MNEIISKIWATEVSVNDPPSDMLTDLIAHAQLLNGSDDLSDFLFEKSEGVNLEKLIYILDVSAWLGNDNGAALHKKMESWLFESNPNKIFIALNLEFFPFLEAEEMYSCLSKIQANYPQFSEKCKFLIAERRKIEKNA